MSIARFSPFELLLLKSRSQVDTAKLLLLAWVLCHRQQVSEGQRRRRLAQVSVHFRHGHELAPVMQIAQQQDLQAIQLAAEVLRRECSREHGLGVMHQAIAVATDTGELSLANHYILRFLADLFDVPPATLATLFQELTGRALTAPEDPSRDAYWRIHDAEHYAKYEAEQARQAEAARQQARQEQQRAEQARQRQQEADQAREQAEREKARQREQQHERERSRRHRQSHQEKKHNHEQPYRATPPDRTTRALAVLGLMPGASKLEVRKAYRRMAQMHHPDRFYTESEHRIALASARFQRIKSAYDYLMHTYQ
ncbi:DnaJ domain-containing protein [Halomonas aquamarina]|uniref:DnaJ domain-containing protein n=1 Tax=Vreelandella aquamarina TaxID=77097 RepID=A0ACC5VX13_9GAMM|nr:DnaJ domain-containing protein [Halomonas aquamarina]MBZ5488202.1 DnaJ domain-containing protein [Halomonas aquamarina]